MGSRVRVPSRPQNPVNKFFSQMNFKTLLFIFSLLFSITSNSQDFISQSLQYDGNNRQYELYIPQSYDGSENVPLLFNFHAGNGTSDSQIYISDMRNLADENNFILVYPQAIADPTDGGSLNWMFKGESDHDDIYFVEAMIDEIATQYSIDQSRVYACGYSLGGEFVHELLCRLNNRIAAGVAVARTMFIETYENCVPEHPTAIMSILGTDDFNSLYNGVEFAGVLYYLSAADTHQFWIDYNNTDPNPIEIDLPNINTNDGSTVTKRIWENGDACVSVVELRVNGGDHDWPGWSGNMDINSDEEIWNFVSNYSLSGQIENCNLGVNEFDKTKIQVYPNPTQEILNITINSNVSNANLSDINGKIIKKFSLITGENKINISKINNQIYFLNIGDFTYKLIKN